ncbi:hypothetical protein AWC38_SpisGene4475 [Stylophora pistillata]|uniref:Uncharacterized protein n=1 Tax=Stylophora pistillata TaxID=50429 RepID=A0A2B4SMX3_STYPI|nr:hypothetical protein AWC38_SpisGene4475 [Stylophora pistillata]
MTRIRKTSPSISEQLPKQMARILYNTLIQEVQRVNTEEMVTSSNDIDLQTEDIPYQSKPLKKQVQFVKEITFCSMANENKGNVITTQRELEAKPRIENRLKRGKT